MGEMLDKIFDEEKDMIDYYIDTYAVEYEGYDRSRQTSTATILKVWEKEKENLYNMFGKQLILSKDYQYKESRNDLIDKLINKTSWRLFINGLERTLNLMARDGKITVDNEYGSYYFPGYFNREDCVDNKLSFDCVFTYKGKKYAFPKDTKFMKYVGKLAEIAGMKDEFEQFRLEHSVILNTSKQHGKVCLSIHPLDFMTMSDNDSNWESCMSWHDNGCYRMGTVEMMNSPTVVVGYLSASTPMNINGDEWNNKKWRQLFVINEHVITAVKPYPYVDEALTRTCLEWLNELSGNQYSEDIYDFGDGENRYLNYYRLAAETKYMYNDFRSCNHLTKIKLPVPDKREGVVIRWRFNYSGPTQCMCCGKTEDDVSFANADTLLCDDCRENSNWVYCEHCGCRIDPDNDEYWCTEDGDYYCPDCRDEYFTWDDIYGEYVYNDYAIRVWVARDRNNPEASHDIYQDRWFWTNESFADERYAHESEERPGEYYILIDEVPRRILTCIFGNGSWSINDIKNYIDKESYAGLKMENPLYYSWMGSRGNNQPEYLIIA